MLYIIIVIFMFEYFNCGYRLGNCYYIVIRKMIEWIVFSFRFYY